MKNDIINVNPRCDCGGRQILDAVIIDPEKCEYRLSFMCLACKATPTFILSIDGFVELPKNLKITHPPDSDLNEIHSPLLLLRKDQKN